MEKAKEAVQRARKNVKLSGVLHLLGSKELRGKRGDTIWRQAKELITTINLNFTNMVVEEDSSNAAGLSVTKVEIQIKAPEDVLYIAILKTMYEQ